MKWILAKKSEGSRGWAGKQKMYEVTAEGSTVLFAWGKAEEDLRVTQVSCDSSSHALEVAREKVAEKVKSGYKVLVAL